MSAEDDRHTASLLERNSSGLALLSTGDEREALSFLSRRPVHTVTLAGFIHDNGLESPLNRGDFYAYRNRDGEIIGIALIGHITLIETDSEEVIEAFALAAREHSSLHLLMGEHEKVRSFWNAYSGPEESPRLLRRAIVLAQQQAAEEFELIPDLRPATLDDLDDVAAIHASMIQEETGKAPLKYDRNGFYQRCARRIKQERIWILTRDGRPVFKADIISQTPHAIYIEGVYVHPEARNQGYGKRCLSQMSNLLLKRCGAVSLFVDEDNVRALNFYLSIGYSFFSSYDVLYF